VSPPVFVCVYAVESVCSADNVAPTAPTQKPRRRRNHRTGRGANRRSATAATRPPPAQSTQQVLTCHPYCTLLVYMHCMLHATAGSAKRVLAIVILSICLSRPGTDSRPGEIETPGFHYMIA